MNDVEWRVKNKFLLSNLKQLEERNAELIKENLSLKKQLGALYNSKEYKKFLEQVREELCEIQDTISWNLFDLRNYENH